MTPEDVKNFYKTTYNFHRLTGMSAVNLSNWLKKGVVPKGTQARLQILSNGTLQADADSPQIKEVDLFKDLEEIRRLTRKIESMIIER